MGVCLEMRLTLLVFNIQGCSRHGKVSLCQDLGMGLFNTLRWAEPDVLSSSRRPPSGTDSNSSKPCSDGPEPLLCSAHGHKPSPRFILCNIGSQTVSIPAPCPAGRRKAGLAR